ncbi:unnamed protein product [Psylliodes chrysocephalus]|nr:unnamed protein product [Psylliodes chrysocephala]
MGVNDLDKVIMYIVFVTKLPGELIYMGYSTGAMLGFIYSTTMPISERLIKLIVAISPSVYPSHLTSPIKYLAPFIDDSKWVMENLGMHQFLPKNKILELLSMHCRLLGIQKIVCDNFIFSIFGYSEEEFNVPMLPILLSKMPSGVSTKTISQFVQSIKRGGTFQRFDHGEDLNYKLYGTKRPPKYDLKKVKTPVYIIYSMYDWFSNHTDVLHLANHLRHVVEAYKVDKNHFGYLDFLFGKELVQLVIQPILQVLELFKINTTYKINVDDEDDDDDYDPENYDDEYE